MTIADFTNIRSHYESETTHIKTAERNGQVFGHKTYKNAGNDSYRVDKLYKELDVLNLIYPGHSEIINDGRNLILSYPFSDGMSLSKFMKVWEFDLEEYLELCLLVAKALQELHSKNIIHLDLNPGNIIYDTVRKKVHIIDFGSAKLHDAKNIYLGNPEGVECDLNYISPEQTGRINRVVDLRTDLYAIGAIMYELATGRKLYNATKPIELVHSHIAKPPPSVLEVNPDFPKAIDQIIQHLLAKNAEDRYFTDYGLIADLDICLKQYHSNGKISDFTPGENDISDQFRISQKCYGREAEITEMKKAFIRAKSGSKELVLVEGHAGTGKSNLVAENHRLLAETNSMFIEGKFDQVNRNIPYSAWVQVFNNFINLLLTENDDTVEKWKERIYAACESNLGYLSLIIPNITWLFKDLKTESSEYSAETQDRLKVTIQSLIKSITESQPLVIFIDDWQWSDHASIELLKYLNESEDLGNLLLIAAYRDNEISDNTFFCSLLQQLQLPDSNISTTTIKLNTLKEEDTLRLLSDSMAKAHGDIIKLNQLIHNRTNGNPLFYAQSLRAIATENLLWYNHTSGKWEWDLKQIKNSIVSDNIVALLISKINNLPATEKILLQKAACIGNKMDIDVLATICKMSNKQVFRNLEHALHDGLLLQQNSIVINDEGEKIRRTELRFAHDRIQQGIYKTLSHEEIRQNHYEIGKILLNNYSESEIKNNVFSLANHLNKSQFKKLTKEECLSIAEINFKASEKAKNLVDYENGLKYIQMGLEVINGENITKDNYSITMPFHLLRYEMAAVIKSDDKLNEWEQKIVNSQPNKFDLIKFQRHKIQGLISQGEIERAIDTGLHVLESYGVKLKKKPSKLDIIISFIKTARCYDKNKIHELANLKPIKDPIQKEITEIFMVLNVACYFSNKDLWALVHSEIVRVFIKEGVTPLSPLAFASYGSILIIGNQDIKTGVAFGKMALELQNNLGSTVALNKTLFCYYTLIDWWDNPIENSVRGLDRAMALSKNAGDFQYYGHSATIKTIYLEHAGLNLNQVKTESINLLNAMEKNLEKIDVYLAKQRLTKIVSLTDPNLMENGLSKEFYDFDEEKDIHHANKQNEIITIHFLDKGLIDYYLKRFRSAYDNVRKEEAIGANTAFGVFSYFDYHFLKSLIKTEVYHDVSRKEQREIKKYLKKWFKDFTSYSKYSPENFKGKALMVKACLQKIDHEENKAFDTYLQAIEFYTSISDARDEGTAFERASELLRKQGKHQVANNFIEKAYKAYLSVGAEGIANRILQEYSFLKRSLQNSNQPLTASSTKSLYNLSNLDLASVFKSTEAISGEIDKEKLIKKLIMICIENAGANEGYLILKLKGKNYVSAYGDVQMKTELFENRLVEDTPAISPKVLGFVERSQESLILGDAINNTVYGNNEYIQSNGVKSIFVVPIINKGNLTGYIYLLNKLTRDAFSDQQEEIINLLSGQIAISLENASLVENLEEKVKERTIAIEKEKETSEKLLLNILPKSTAQELKTTGKAMPRYYKDVSVMFVDFKNFSGKTQKMDYRELVKLVDEYFKAFDDIIDQYNVEKIKTIGDAYLCVSGIPIESNDHASKIIHTAIAIQAYIAKMKAEKQNANMPYFDARIGIHSGPVVSGVVGTKKFAFDIWGDTVNIAARMESASEIGKISISESTYQKVNREFNCTHRGKIHAKNIGELDMYFVENIIK